MNKKETALLIKQIDALYPGRISLEPSTVEMWHRVLADQEYSPTIERLVRYSKENKFPPSISDLHIKTPEPYRSNILDKIKEWEANASRS